MGGVAVGGAGTIPFGLSAPVNPPGSCPANPSGPIADGTQLDAITTNPRANGGSAPPATVAAPPAATTVATTAATTVATVATVAAPQVTPATTSGTGFKLANGQDAQALNAKFATLTANSACTGTNFSFQTIKPLTDSFFSDQLERMLASTVALLSV